MVSTTGGATPHDPNEAHHYYRQNSAPVSVAAGGSDPLQIGDLWSDTTANLLKRCTGINADTFATTEGGAAHTMDGASHSDATQGDVPYAGASGDWALLGAGTGGQVLSTQGAGANPQWINAAGGGDVTGAANLDDNTLIKGDGGAKGIQDSGVTLDDSDNMAGVNSLVFKGDTTLTIVSGDVTVTGFYHTIAGEGAANDDLIGIIGGSDGEIIVIRPSSDSVTITVKHNGSAAASDNILLNDDIDYVMDQEDDALFLLYDAGLDTNGAWFELSRGNIRDATASVTGLATAAQITKLDGIEALADVTDAGNVNPLAIAAVEGEATLDLLGNVTIEGTKSLSVDVINEKDAADGVTIDGLLIKDSGIPASAVTAHELAIDHDNLNNWDPAQHRKEVVLNFIIDGGGSTITTGIKGDVEIAFAGTITAVRLFGDQSGAIVVDIWKDSFANFPPTVADTITASALPTITASGVKSEDATLTGWTTAITKGDTLRFNVDSVTSIQRLTLSLSIDKT